MDRLFSLRRLAALCCMMLALAAPTRDTVQPVFFSMLFPQLMPEHAFVLPWLRMDCGEEALLL